MYSGVLGWLLVVVLFTPFPTWQLIMELLHAVRHDASSTGLQQPPDRSYSLHQFGHNLRVDC